MMALIWNDDRLGMLDPVTDSMYVADDFGNAVSVPFSLPPFYFSEH